MRLVLLAVLCLTPAFAMSAQAQVQPNNPNAANQAMQSGSQLRTLQQQQTTQSDMLRMNIERNQAATPAPNTGANTVGPIGGTGVRR
jgi:hypothetical protein